MLRYTLIYSRNELELTRIDQPWRAVTNFFYFGTLGVDFVFHMFFLYVVRSIHLGQKLNSNIACDTVVYWRSLRSPTGRQIMFGS
jgi:hypothetical protein